MKKFKLKLKNPARELEGKFYTVECVFLVVIWTKFRMWQDRVDDYREKALLFKIIKHNFDDSFRKKN